MVPRSPEARPGRFYLHLPICLNVRSLLQSSCGLQELSAEHESGGTGEQASCPWFLKRGLRMLSTGAAA